MARRVIRPSGARLGRTPMTSGALHAAVLQSVSRYEVPGCNALMSAGTSHDSGSAASCMRDSILIVPLTHVTTASRSFHRLFRLPGCHALMSAGASHDLVRLLAACAVRYLSSH